jgi:superoxide reductase
MALPQTRLSQKIQTADWKEEKHAPAIEAPDAVGAGEPFDVKLTLCKEIAHPNTTEHFIAWIELYYQPEGGKFLYNLGRVDFAAHGATAEGPNTLACNTEPYAVFKVKLDKPGQLIATSWCNIHGLWENSAELKF